MAHEHEFPEASRTLDKIVIRLFEHMLEMEKRMATFEDIQSKLVLGDAQAKDRATELAKAKSDLGVETQKVTDLEAAAVIMNQKITDLEAAAAAAPAAVITADQATILDNAAAAIVVDTALPAA